MASNEREGARRWAKLAFLPLALFLLVGAGLQVSGVYPIMTQRWAHAALGVMLAIYGGFLLRYGPALVGMADASADGSKSAAELAAKVVATSAYNGPWYGKLVRVAGAALVLVGIGLAAAGCAGARSAHEYAYSAERRDLVRANGGRKEALRAGRVQQVSIVFPAAMESVAGQIGDLSVPFQSDASGRKWVAAFEMPSREALGPERSLRVYAKNGDAVPGASPEPDMLEIPVE